MSARDAATPAPTARRIAAAVLARVERDGAFAAAVLDAELGRARQLAPRDRAFCTELVYGVLRYRAWLDAEVARHAARGAGSIDPRTRVELAIAAYQLFFSRVPAFAAVNEGVDAVRRARGAPVGRFANAVLRKVAREAEGVDSAELGPRAAWESTPEWMRAALARALGEDGARAFVASGTKAPPLGVRVERAGERQACLDRLRGAAPDASFEPGSVSPLAILARGAGDLRVLPGYAEGQWSIQEEGSQLVALAVGARPGERVLDACAGRGNKSAVLARAVGPTGALDAVDVSPDKLARLATDLARVGLAPRAAYAVDWSVGPGDCVEIYDRALVDAPCSGTGTLRRRPELMTRRKPDDVPQLARLQGAILARVAERVRPGGRLIYAVCSVLREEAEEVVDAVLEGTPALEPWPFESPPVEALAGGARTLRLLPHVQGTDGYFLASLRKKE